MTSLNEKKTKVLVVTNLLPHYQIDFFNYLKSNYCDVDLIVAADIETNDPLNFYNKKAINFEVVNNKMYFIKGLIFRRGVLELINKIKPDKLIIYANPRELSLSFLMLLLKLRGVEFYIHGMFHRIGGQKFYSSLYYRLSSFLAKKVFVYSRKGAEVLLALGVDYSKINVIGTAIDETVSLTEAELINETQLNDFKVSNSLINRKIALQVVRLSSIKQPELIVEVAALLKSEFPEILFVLIGGGELYNDIRNKIDFLGLQDNVLMLGPIYDKQELSLWFKSASVFVIPTCIGLSAHHAMSYGLPVITDDNLLNQASEFDILSDGLNSIIYKSGSIKDFANAIVQVLHDEDYRLSLSLNALATVKVKHSLANKARNYYRALFS
ncbi:hypothetical protein AEST_14070 [Alishewanella aestuarii B11]|uniref:Glycosyl transferase family 1 domain-containing protein n=1 Tax=Alishewanella aestuarii B11 TaxID=1197174 RepID=J2IEX2_9ALTE|nr:glycosyltransferase family 4 protein [Alishewanella aestuarii]EJI85742.1 hypothetical protein AEST_14070 [Alishewanella aestuarii B11]